MEVLAQVFDEEPGAMTAILPGATIGILGRAGSWGG